MRPIFRTGRFKSNPLPPLPPPPPSSPSTSRYVNVAFIPFFLLSISPSLPLSLSGASVFSLASFFFFFSLRESLRDAHRVSPASIRARKLQLKNIAPRPRVDRRPEKGIELRLASAASRDCSLQFLRVKNRRGLGMVPEAAGPGGEGIGGRNLKGGSTGRVVDRRQTVFTLRQRGDAANGKRETFSLTIQRACHHRAHYCFLRRIISGFFFFFFLF